MKTNVGFVQQYLDNANQFYATALKQFSFYKKILGTKVIISRIKKTASVNIVFGASVSSTLPEDKDVEKFDHVIIINLNDMKNVYLKTAGEMDIYDNEDVIKIGDVLTYARKNQEYKFKVIRHESFSEAEGVLNKYTINSFTETNSLGKNN